MATTRCSKPALYLRSRPLQQIHRRARTINATKNVPSATKTIPKSDSPAGAFAPGREVGVAITDDATEDEGDAVAGVLAVRLDDVVVVCSEGSLFSDELNMFSVRLFDCEVDRILVLEMLLLALLLAPVSKQKKSQLGHSEKVNVAHKWHILKYFNQTNLSAGRRPFEFLRLLDT